jgi:hypothetical protein
VLLRGGDTYHTSAKTSDSADTPVGGVWQIKQSGTSSSRIHIGTDETWFSGSAFKRPVFNMDNPLSTSTVSSCQFDDSSLRAIDISGASYLDVDDFEFTGNCSSNPSGSRGYVWVGGSSHNKVSNSYFHGWTLTSGATDDSEYLIGANTIMSDTGFEIAYNVFDGVDSTYGTVCNSPSCVPTAGSKAATGWAIAGNCPNIHHNVIRHVSNGIQCGNILVVHDNLMEYQFEPSFGGRHGNVMEDISGVTGGTCHLYNNIVRNEADGVTWWPQCNTGYVFNNVFENLADGPWVPTPNGLMISPPGFSNTAVTLNWYIYNNTFDSTVSSQAFGGNSTTPYWGTGSTIEWGNNHFIGVTALSKFFGCQSPSSCNQTEKGGEVFQTTSQAASQGYTLSNNYQPTSSSDATATAGSNQSSYCSEFSSDAAYCSGTSDAAYEASGKGGKVATSPAITIVSRPASGTWTAGAYQIGGSSTPNAPTGLAAVVK